MFKLPAVAPCSWIRVHLIQQFLQKKKDKYQCVLCIPGIDSFYDTASLNCMDFLFPNYSAPENKAKGLEDGDEVMEDIMFCLTENGISIYCNPFTYAKLLSESSGYNHSKIFCLDEEKYNDADHAEEFKIRCLAHFTNNMQMISIPFTSSSVDDKVNHVEKWPLIQAYALEDFGKHGFFTLKHDVVNFSDALRLLSAELMDYYTLNSVLIPKCLPAFTMQWTNTVAAICAVADNPTLVGEINLAETFESYVKHGHASSGLNDETDLSKYTMVLPAEECSPALCKKLLSSGSSSEKNMGANSNYRSVFEGPGAIVCFLKSSVAPGFAAGRTLFVETPKTGASQELKELESNLYRCLVEATEYAVSEYVAIGGDKEVSSQKTEKIFLKALHSKLAELKAPVQVEHVFAIENFTNENSEIAEIDFPRAKFVLSAVFLSHKGGKIGVLFADTFLPVAIATSDSGIFSAQVFWLTNGISRYLTIRSLDVRRMLTNSNYTTAEEGAILLFGTQLAMTAYLPKHSPLFPDAIQIKAFKVSLSSLDMSLELENGLTVNLSGSLDVISVGCFEQSSPPADFDGMFIEIHFSMRTRKNAAFPFTFNEADDPKKTADGDVLVICLQAKTMPHREFYRLVLPSWGVSKEVPGVVSEKAAASAEKVSHLATETKHISRFSSIISAHLKNGNGAPASALPRQFLGANLAAVQIAETQQIAGQKYLPPKRELEMALTGVSTGQNGAISSIGKISVHVICGMPESGSDLLAKSVIAKKSNDEIAWLGVHSLLQTMGESAPFAVNFRDEQLHVLDETALQRFRQFVEENLPQQSTNSALFKGHVLILCPFFVNLPCLFAKLERNFNEKLTTASGSTFELSFKSAILCLDGFSDMLLPNKSVNPIAQAQLRPGILSAVIAYLAPGRNRDHVRGQNFDAVRRTIRALNPSLAVYRNVSDIDFELLPQFWSKEMCSLRSRFWTDTERAHFAHHGEATPLLCFARSSQAVTLVFNQRVLQRDKLTANLYLLTKQVNGPSMHHYDEEQQTGEPSASASAVLPSASWYVWHVAGELGFGDSDEVVRLSFTLPQQIFRIAPLHRSSSNATFFLTFYGENLDEKVLRDWLRQSAHSRPAQKAYLRIEDLAPAFWGKLQTEHYLDRLPEGWFYNGTYYVDGSGEKAYRHPLLNEIAANYVANFNAEADRANTEARSIKMPDLFD